MVDATLRSGYAPVNGLQLYYEIHGAGEPLVLLHGGLGMTGMFGDLLPRLAQGRQVIAVDLQGHGRTADIDRPLRIHIANVLLGAGTRLFAVSGGEVTPLERTRVIESPFATHLRFAVRTEEQR